MGDPVRVVVIPAAWGGRVCEGCAEHQHPLAPGIAQPLGQDPPRGHALLSQLLSGALAGEERP